MQEWDVTFHYPRRVGNVKVLGIWAHHRTEAVATAIREVAPEIIAERGKYIKVSARKSYSMMMVAASCHRIASG